jgi:DNA-binding transcriptional LysR family regulator
MNARPYEWSDLEIFLELARAGSLAAAAEKLRVDASTVHRRLGKLEAAMRTKLFLRSTRGYALSEAGQDLLTHTTAMDEQATSAFRKVVARDEQPIGTVRLATVDDLAVHVVPPIVTSFREKHPRITVFVDVRDSFVALAKHEADVALRIGLTSSIPGEGIARRVCTIGTGFFASRAYLKRHGRPKKPEDLFEHTFIRPLERFAGMPSERFTDRYSDPAKIALRSNSFYAIFGAIRAGVGIGFAPLILAATDKSIERLDLDVGEPMSQPSLYLVVHTDMRKNARVRAFVDHTFAALTAQRNLFEHGVA